MHASSRFFLVVFPERALGTVAHAAACVYDNYVAISPPPHFPCVKTAGIAARSA